MSSFNPTFQQITDAYSKGQCVKTDQTEDGKFRNYTKIISMFGEVTKSVDGVFGGNTFVSNDKTVTANTEDSIRGFGFPSCLFITADGISLVFY